MRAHQPLLSYGASAAAFAASPTFYAPLINTLVPSSSVGSGTPTFARALVATLEDWEGIVRYAKSGEARFVGARRVGNLVAGHSQSLANASWIKDNTGTSSVAAVATANFATDPLGGATASRLQTNKGSDAAVGYSRAYQNLVFPLAGVRSLRVSVWLKSNSGTPTVSIQCFTGASFTGSTISITLDSTWRRYTTAVVTGVAADTDGYIMIGSIGTNQGAVGNSTTADFLVWGAMFEEVSGQSNQNPAEYVSVGVLADPWHGCNVDGVKCFATLNGNTVASNIVTEATGAAITSAGGGSSRTTDTSGPFGLLMEGPRDQLVLQSQTFDNVAWFKDAGTITANSTVAPDGLQTADTFNENSATANHDVNQTYTGTSALTRYTFSVYLKKAGRNWVCIDLNNGATDCTVFFDINNGVAGTVTAGPYSSVSAAIVAAANGFYRCSITFTKSSSSTVTMFILSATGNGGTTAIAGLNAAAWIAWGAQLEQSSVGPTTETPYLSSYIVNNTSGSITKPSDSLSYVFTSNASATVGTAYAEVRSLWPTATGFYPIVGFAAATQHPLFNNGAADTAISIGDGTNIVSKAGLSSTNTAVRKRASSWTGSTLAVAGDGVAAATGSFDGNMGSSGIGIGTPPTPSNIVWNGSIRNVKIFTVAATAAELASMTT